MPVLSGLFKLFEMEAYIDNIGDSYAEFNIKEFSGWLATHKNNLGKMSMKTLNHKIHWVDDDKNRYKLHCIRGKYILKRCSKDYYNDKHDFMNKLVDLERQLKELAQTLENFMRLDTPELEPGNVGSDGAGAELNPPVLDIRFPRV